MADGTGIEWTDATWNPIRGCSRVSEGCRHCYAETVAARFSGPGQPYAGLARFVDRPGGAREARWTGTVRIVEGQELTPLRWQRPRRIFVNSMSDLFHENVPDDAIDRILAVMALAHWHTFQVLTKRPKRMRQYFAEKWQPAPAREVTIAGETISVPAEKRPGDRWDQVDRAIDELTTQGRMFDQDRFWTPEGALIGRPAWPRQPLPNLWLGVSVEDQAAADERIPHLLATPAAVRFISAEPLLGPVDVRWSLGHPIGIAAGFLERGSFSPGLETLHPLDWIIAGGESGPGARPVHPQWINSLRDQCAAAGTAFFFKQWGEFHPSAAHDHEAMGCLRTPEAINIAGDREYRPSEQFRLITSELGWAGMCRVGKKAAGRLLDGRTHDAMPGARHDG